MVHIGTVSKCIVVFLLLCTIIQIIECKGGRGFGGGKISKGWGISSSWRSKSSSSSGSSGSSSSSSSKNTGYGSSSSISLSPSRPIGTSYGANSGTITKPNSNIPVHSTSYYSSQRATPSASGQHYAGGNYAPSAPQLPTSNNKPAPAPGWNVGNNGNIQRQQTQGLNNAQYPNQPGAGGMHPPPYSSVSNQPGAGAHPPPYPGLPNHYSNGPPPPYPGGVNNYPGPPLGGVPPPPYSNHYSGGAGMGGHYPTQHGTHTYPSHYQGSHAQYYPQSNNLPPPPPGYSPYGQPYYQKPKSGIKASHVMMGLALWQLTRPHHHHHFYGSGYDTYNNPGYGYHEFNRQRYTTTYGSQHSSSNAPGANNVLEMTHYVVPDDKGAYRTVVGNMTCLSVYDAKSVSQWANRTMDDFYKKFPGSVFPLFETGKNESNKFENFTMIPGRIIHEETVSVTCCGTNKGPMELTMLTSGKSPDVNCLHFIGKIPFRKLTFVKVNHVPAVNVSMEDWKPIQLAEPNFNSTSTPTPLAPFPTTDNTTKTTAANTTETTTPSVDLTQTFAPLGINNSSSTTSDINTFPSLGSNNGTITSSPS